MSLQDKDILITPNRGQSNDPKIEFKGADASSGPNTITLNVYPTDNGTLSFEGSAGQLFSITNSLTGTIFSVNDVSGIPSIEVLDTGLVKLAQYSGNVLLGTATDNGTDKLQVNGSVSADVIKSTIATGTAPFTVASTTVVTNLNADLLDGNHASAFLSSSATSTQDGYFGNIHLYDDTNPSHYLVITNFSDLSAARTLSVNVNNADRTISLSGNLTVSAAATVSGTNTGDQTSVSGSAGSVVNAVTFNNAGSGDASGTTYDGSAARTISYNTVGAASSGHGHYIGTTAVQSSSANQAVTGITSITGGTGTTDISFLSANTTSADSGAITVSTGTTTTSGTTGAVTISSGNSAGASGNTNIKTGTAVGAVSSGNISLSTGNATSTNGTAGEISIVAGDSNTTTVSYTGEIYISGGNNTNTAGGTRGSVTIKGGNSSSTSANATGSDVYIYGGLATSTASVVKASGNVYIDGGGIGANGTRNFGSIYIGNQANGTDYGTTHVTIGKSGTEVRLPGVGTSTAFVKIGANGTLSSDTNTYLVSSSGQTAGSTNSGFLQYSGVTATAGQINGSTTAPTDTTRLNYEGYLYATRFYGDGSQLTGISLPSGQTAGSSTSGYLQYSGTSVVAGQMNGSTTAPTDTTRLNYEGYLYATRFYGNGSQLTGVTTLPRVVTGGSSGTLTIDSDVTDVYNSLSISAAITIAQPSGTPVDGQKLIIRLKDNGVAKSITWTTTSGAFRVIGVTLPTSTVANKTTYIGCIYNSTASFWDAVSATTEL